MGQNQHIEFRKRPSSLTSFRLRPLSSTNQSIATRTDFRQTLASPFLSIVLRSESPEELPRWRARHDQDDTSATGRGAGANHHRGRHEARASALRRARLERIVSARRPGRGDVQGAATHGADRRRRKEPASVYRPPRQAADHARSGVQGGVRQPVPLRRRPRPARGETPPCARGARWNEIDLGARSWEMSGTINHGRRPTRRFRRSEEISDCSGEIQIILRRW